LYGVGIHILGSEIHTGFEKHPAQIAHASENNVDKTAVMCVHVDIGVIVGCLG